MKTYVIGDLQGCHEQALLMLERIREHAARDGVAEPLILFAGDLINRGPDSLATLRHVRKLAMASGGLIDSVLGNHDLHLLAVAAGVQNSKSDTLDEILARARPRRADRLAAPAAAGDVRDGHLLVHAGVPPQWTRRRRWRWPAEVEDDAARRRLDRVPGADVWQSAGPLGRRPAGHRPPALHRQRPDPHAPVLAPTAHGLQDKESDNRRSKVRIAALVRGAGPPHRPM
jgi:hypothetical protein